MSIGAIPSGIGSTHLHDSSATSGSGVASLSGQIRQDTQQLDDWTTCVSAKTTKGQAEIQRLSGEISAAKDRELRLASTQSQSSAVSPSRSVDVWA